MTTSMFVFVYGVLFSVYFISYECEGAITSPPDGKKYLFLPGQTAEIKWEFDDVVSSLTIRTWSYKNGSYTHLLAKINEDGPTVIKTKLFIVDIKKPATLILKNVSRSYSGVYQFSLTSSVAFSSDVEVSVASAPTVKLSCSSHDKVDEGKNFTCVCRGEGGVPAPANVTWYKDGDQIGETKKENNTLSLTDVNATDSGTYKCVAQSYHTEALKDEKSIQLMVNVSSTTLQPSTTTTLQPSTSATTLQPSNATTPQLSNATTPQPSTNATTVTTKGSSGASGGTEWYIVVVSFLSGIFLASPLV